MGGANFAGLLDFAVNPGGSHPSNRLNQGRQGFRVHHGMIFPYHNQRILRQPRLFQEFSTLFQGYGSIVSWASDGLCWLQDSGASRSSWRERVVWSFLHGLAGPRPPGREAQPTGGVCMVAMGKLYWVDKQSGFRTMKGEKMKPTLLIASVTVAAILGGLVGAGLVSLWNRGEPPRAEGVIFSVEYQQGTGTGGFTRINTSKAVPGGNGSWNVDAYGKLYRDFLVITFPNKPDLGPEVIPTHRLLSVRFGDGGIKEVPKNQAP